MPRFEPFAGLRYNTPDVVLADVIAPPYDVVDNAERAELAARSPYNAIHVELPLPDDSRGLDRYANAATLLESWLASGAVRRDLEPSFYIYRMAYLAENGDQYSTTGVIGALGLDVAGGNEVLPHERTMPKPKGDRLDLLRACRANLSPIWGLSLSSGLAEACVNATNGAPPVMSATDDDGITHELWPVSDPAAVAQIAGLIAASPVVIADGHHRYETATFYRNERRAANGDLDGEYDLVMALIVELTAEELNVQPIHRLVSGLDNPALFDEILAKYFRLEQGPSEFSELVSAMTSEGALGLVRPEGNQLLIPLPSVEEASEADLDSSRLDVALADLPAHDLVYQHGARLAVDAVSNGVAQAAILLRPATVAQIADTADSGRRMPPKTTFFHPKPRTGMVFRTVAG